MHGQKGLVELRTIHRTTRNFDISYSREWTRDSCSIQPVGRHFGALQPAFLAMDVNRDRVISQFVVQRAVHNSFQDLSAAHPHCLPLTNRER